MTITSDNASSVSKSKFNENQTRHILVVDDDYEISESIKYALANAGYEVSLARDGNEGVAYAEAKNPDLMILDMMMPKRSGLLVLERLRQHSDNSVPVIVITGNDGNRHREYATLLGVSEYLHKPFTMDRLLDSVANLLDESS